MALFFKKQKTKGGDGTINSEDEILGYLDELYRRKVPLTLKAGNEVAECSIFFIDDKSKLIRIQGNFRKSLPSGVTVKAGFPLDRTWWEFTAKTLVQDDKIHLHLPSCINHKERRKHPRTNFSPREVVKVTILEGLGSGNGVFGIANDISVGGLSLTIERAMRLSDEKELQPTPTLFKKGTQLMVVRINRLPGAPMMELTGLAQRVWRDGRWRMAISFPKLSREHEAGIRKFVTPRMVEFKLVRRSMKKREEMDAQRDKELGLSGPRDLGNTASFSGKPGPPNPAVDKPIPPKAATAESELPRLSREESPISSFASVSAPEDPPARESVDAPPASGSLGKDRQRMLLMGEEVAANMPFMNEDNPSFEIVIGTTPVGIVRLLTESTFQYLILGPMFKGRNSMEIIEKIKSMGALNNVEVVLYGKDIPPKDVVKLRMAGVDKVINEEMESAPKFLQALIS